MEQAVEHLARYRRIIDPLFDQFLEKQLRQAKSIGPTCEGVVRQLIKIMRGGKRIRGALVCVGYELAGGKDNGIYRASLFLELFHAGLLIHDDILDRDEKRRGVATIHSIYGDSMAINAGDLVYSWTLSYLLSIPFPADRIMRVTGLLASYFTKTIYGQMLDISTSEMLETIRLKTAEYTGVFPLRVGATLAGMINKKAFDALISYGRNLGMVFQLQDDILDTTNVAGLVKLRETYYQKGIQSIEAVTKKKSFRRLLRSFLNFAKNRKN